MTQPMRPILQETTRAVHHRIEAMWTPSGGFSSEDHYRAFLRALFRVHTTIGLAAALRRSEGVVEEAARIAALADDLEMEAPPRVAPLAESVDYAWGVGYVLNGSALGASILLKSGAVAETWARRYLERGRTYAQTGQLRRFFDALNTAPLHLAGVQAGALDTFAAFETPDLDTAPCA